MIQYGLNCNIHVRLTLDLLKLLLLWKINVYVNLIKHYDYISNQFKNPTNGFLFVNLFSVGITLTGLIFILGYWAYVIIQVKFVENFRNFNL